MAGRFGGIKHRLKGMSMNTLNIWNPIHEMDALFHNRLASVLCGGEQTSSAWAPVTTVELQAPCRRLVWGPRPALLAAGFDTSATVLLETAFYRKVRDGIGVIQSGPQALQITPATANSASVASMEVKAGIRISGADHTESYVVVWSGKKVEVFSIQGGAR